MITWSGRTCPLTQVPPPSVCPPPPVPPVPAPPPPVPPVPVPVPPVPPFPPPPMPAPPPGPPVPPMSFPQPTSPAEQIATTSRAPPFVSDCNIMVRHLLRRTRSRGEF